MPPPKLLQPATIAAACLLFLTLTGGCAPSFQQKTLEPTGYKVSKSHPAVNIAQGMLGKPYRPGGNSPQKGFDCSGLVHYAFSQAGIQVPRTTKSLYHQATPVPPGKVRAGDLLFFRINGKVSHVGIYVAEKTFIHAPSSGKRVSYAQLDNPYWSSRLTKTGRVD